MEKYLILCDICGKELSQLSESNSHSCFNNTLKLIVGNSEHLDFCNYQCLLKHILIELKKLNYIENNLEFGNEGE